MILNNLTVEAKDRREFAGPRERVIPGQVPAALINWRLLVITGKTPAGLETAPAR